MSTSPNDTQSHDPTVECRHPDCTSLGRKWEFQGDYCSDRCETRHDGREALAAIKYDHCRCFTCFRALKTINPPKPDFEFVANGHGWTRNADGDITLEYYDQSVTRSAATGFQFLTPTAGKGEKQRDDRVITGTICTHCGQTSHVEHDEAVADRDAIGRLATLLDADDDVTIDPETLHRTYSETRDVELAVGRALPE